MKHKPSFLSHLYKLAVYLAVFALPASVLAGDLENPPVPGAPWDLRQWLSADYDDTSSHYMETDSENRVKRWSNRSVGSYHMGQWDKEEFRPEFIDGIDHPTGVGTVIFYGGEFLKSDVPKSVAVPLEEFDDILIVLLWRSPILQNAVLWEQGNLSIKLSEMGTYGLAVDGNLTGEIHEYKVNGHAVSVVWITPGGDPMAELYHNTIPANDTYSIIPPLSVSGSDTSTLGGTETGNYFTGEIRELLIYNEALTEEMLHHITDSLEEAYNLFLFRSECDSPVLSANASAQSTCVGEEITFTAYTGCPDGEYTWSGDVEGNGESITASFAEPGEKTVTVTYTLGEFEKTETISVEVVESLTVETSSETACVGTPVIFSASSSCPGGDYTWSGDVQGTGRSVSTTFEDPGTHTVTVSYNHSGGEVSDSVSVVVTEPDVVVITSSSSVYPGETVSVSATASCGNVQFTGWSGDVTGTSSLISQSFANPGEYEATANFEIGDETFSGSATFVVKPEVHLSVSPDPACGGETVTFTATGNPEGGDYSWEGDVSGSGSSKSLMANVGESEYSATVTYSVDEWVSKPVTRIVSVQSPGLEASVTPESIKVGESAEFSASVICGNENYSWSGVTGTGPSFTETFNQAGYHEITVTNQYPGGGSNTETLYLTVDPGFPDKPSECDGEAKPNLGRLFFGEHYNEDLTVLIPRSDSEDSQWVELPIIAGIVTQCTPEGRDLWGELKVVPRAGSFRGNNFDIILDDESVNVGDGLARRISGHNGCGVHDWHNWNSSVKIRLIGNDPGALLRVLNNPVPDPTPENTTVPEDNGNIAQSLDLRVLVCEVSGIEEDEVIVQNEKRTIQVPCNDSPPFGQVSDLGSGLRASISWTGNGLIVPDDRQGQEAFAEVTFTEPGEDLGISATLDGSFEGQATFHSPNFSVARVDLDVMSIGSEEFLSDGAKVDPGAWTSARISADLPDPESQAVLRVRSTAVEDLTRTLEWDEDLLIVREKESGVPVNSGIVLDEMEGDREFTVLGTEEFSDGSSTMVMLEVMGPQGTLAEDEVKISPIRVRLLPDFNRDGKIDDEDRNLALETDPEGDPVPFYFWINDDNDDPASELGSSARDVPGQGRDNAALWVNGIRDLVDFCPLYIDFHGVLEAFDLNEVDMRLVGGPINYVLPVEYLDEGLSPEQAGDYLTDPDTATALKLAEKHPASRRFSKEFLEEIVAGRGIILLEGIRESSAPIRLVLDYEGKRWIDKEIPIQFSPVEEMYRQVNLSDVIPGTENDYESNVGEPEGFPDSINKERWFVFLHGVFTSQQNARGWNAQMFKRLFWSGSQAKFVGVTWDSDTSPNYYRAVKHAFITAESLPNHLSFLSEENTVVSAYSLGNIVVSAAMDPVQGTPFSPDQFFMFHAAVPIEAYDPGQTTGTGSTGKMWENIRNPDWTVDGVSYDDRVTAPFWHELFLDGELDDDGQPIYGDNRQDLTWRGLFSNIDVAYNFYSSGEEVLNNASGDIPAMVTGPEPLKKQANLWTFQEMKKGTLGLHSAVPLIRLHPIHGGWGVAGFAEAPAYWNVTIPFGSEPTWEPYTPAEVNQQDSNGDWVIPDSALREMPFFKHFLTDQNVFDEHFYDGQVLLAPLGDSSASTMAGIPFTQYKLLAEAIPSRSFAAGANEIPLLDIQSGETRNFDMQDMQNGWPEERPAAPDGTKPWLHGDIRTVAYPYVHEFFDKIVEEGNLK